MNNVLNATLLQRHTVSEGLARFVFRLDDDREALFTPGQFTLVGLPPDEAESASGHKQRMIRRVYSIANAGPVSRDVEFLIRRIDSGKLTPRLWAMTAGDRVWINETFTGDFTLDPIPNDSNILMVATGSGIAPFVSMVRSFHEHDRWRRLVLIHGVRFPAELAYRDELAAMPEIEYVPVVSRDLSVEDPQVHHGQVQSVVTSLPLDPKTWHAMLCGNADMVDQVRSMLEDLQFVASTHSVDGNLHLEPYW